MKKTVTTILSLFALAGASNADEEITKKVIWDNGPFDTVLFSGFFSSRDVCGDDFQLSRNTVIGSLTVWVHDIYPTGEVKSVGEIDSLDAFTGTLSVGFYRDGGDAPGAFVASRSIVNPEIVDTEAISPVEEHVFRIHGDFSTPLTLPKGDYWIVFHNGTWLSPHEGPNDLIIRGTQAQSGSRAVIADSPTAPAGWTDHADVRDLAFQLHTTQGFLGHDISVFLRYYNGNNLQGRFGPPYILGTEQVGPNIEFEPWRNELGAAGGFDFDAFSIEIDESTLWDFGTAASGNFNGYVFEDTNDTLPDFLSVTLDESVSTRVPSQILVSPNTIWVNDESYFYGPDEFVRLIVTFAEKRPAPVISLSPGTKGSMLLEAPTVVGKTYQFERSTDLQNWVPFDLRYTATSPFITTHLKPTGLKEFYHLREVE